jgi:DNA-binding transcriptional ArsR family regulator
MMTNDQSEEMAELYSEGLTYVQIAKFYNIAPQTIGQHLRRLRELGLLTKLNAYDVDDDKRDKARFKICCAMHLADLYLHHGYRVREYSRIAFP